ncbi:MAG: hypothetical protein AB7F22_31070 [Reyranella sp.]|uniref:hypothetical protein n=1 Tax=Reyranella sp. TaxID=1929291 RepID=UPI003D1278B5
MPDYNASRFVGTFKTRNGNEIWTFLNEPDSIARMEAATYLCRPAVEALSPGLIAKFGQGVAERRTKQMIGHMVRQILERAGYIVDRQDVPINRAGNIFSYATRYKAGN